MQAGNRERGEGQRASEGQGRARAGGPAVVFDGAPLSPHPSSTGAFTWRMTASQLAHMATRCGLQYVHPVRPVLHVPVDDCDVPLVPWLAWRRQGLASLGTWGTGAVNTGCARMWVDRSAEPGQVQATVLYVLPIPAHSLAKRWMVTNTWDTDRPPRTSPASAPFNPPGPSIPPARHPIRSHGLPTGFTIGSPPHCLRCPSISLVLSPHEAQPASPTTNYLRVGISPI